MSTTWKIIGVGVGVVVIAGAVWFFFFRSTPTEQPPDTGGAFSTASSQSVAVTPDNTTNNIQTTDNTTQAVQQKVFRVMNGPVVSATVVQTLQPTTTIARYVQQNNGHVFDLLLDSSGAVPKAIS
ncbi:MAG: hypothetical protein Q8P58_00690, partial [Candidatus Adlerbacteria bacterium]|nr:hypothetical protein [Candidatus Adlerbacteria bacterium]